MEYKTLLTTSNKQ